MQETPIQIPEQVQHTCLGKDLLWRELRVQPFASPTPTLFLDRDGVIIQEKEYISKPTDVELLPGIVELIHYARRLGMAVVEITNQAGIGRGYSGWAEFIAVENAVTAVLGQNGAEMDAVFACPFHPQAEGAYRVADHPWRKPNAGMLLEAAKLLNLALPKSVLVGDKGSDQCAARAAGLAFGVHVLTGHGAAEEEASRSAAAADFPVYVVIRAHEATPLLRNLLSGN